MRGKGNIILIIVVSAVLTLGTSFALKSFGIGRGTSFFSDRGSYEDNVLKASLGDDRGNQGYRGGCNSSGGGCNISGSSRGSCCGGGGGSASGANVEKVKAGVLSYYTQKYGDKAVEVQVKDYGCHMEAAILKDGKVIKRLSISGGNINEIG